MTIDNNIHNQGFISKWMSWLAGTQPVPPAPPAPPLPPEKGWGEWLGTPIFAIANYAKMFFSSITAWWKGRNDPDRVILPIGKAVDSLRKLVLETSKADAKQAEIAETYQAVYADLPKYVRAGLEATAAEMLLQGKLRKKMSTKPINLSDEKALKKAKVILQKPQNKFFDLQPVFQRYLNRMEYRIP